MPDLTHLAQLDCDPIRLVRALRLAGLKPSPPEAFGPAGLRIALDIHGGSVIVSQAPIDGGEWLHASIAWRGHIPTYDDLAVLKAGVFGDHREAYQVFPRRSRHVNIHAHALHLWGRADGARVLPDFGAAGTI
ncbi:hypothetical protein AB0B89_23720 [Sphaerisporangium sp. NPDC049002]|uniref:DUF7694 domain-containing protein n=1 Tax=Sphaerisporangium sp. NPDC049002 TaxID=3155392 RepID=UPI0033C8CFAD